MEGSALKAFTKSPSDGIACEDVIKCVLAISEEGWGIFHHLVKKGPTRVDDVAEYLGKDRSTAYRELHKLINCGICTKEQNSIKEGGYYFLYQSKDVEKIREETEKCIDATYDQLKQAIKSNFSFSSSD